MIRAGLLAAALALSFGGGFYASAYMAASLMVARSNGDCIAVDQDRGGSIVGRWSPRDGRCMLRDWRMWHPVL